MFGSLVPVITATRTSIKSVYRDLRLCGIGQNPPPPPPPQSMVKTLGAIGYRVNVIGLLRVLGSILKFVGT